MQNLTTAQRIRPSGDIVNFVDRIIKTAIDEGASDIHFQPNREGMIVRFRVDGILKIVSEVPPDIIQSINARIKIMAQLDTTGLPRPQEGNIKYMHKDRSVDMRVSIFPTSYGECIVLRILESVKQYENIEKLGLSKEQAVLIEETIKKPYGLVLVTGPTGSGKSTTLFTIISKLNEVGRSLMTLEDPIERKVDMVRQTQINPDIGLTFASGLRYLLRQDPDIIMVGEIRDKDTAQIAVEAAITGQLVFATIHTNNAAGAIIRLLNMDIEPFLIVSALRLVTAQRLARANCKHCLEEYKPAEELIRRVEAPEDMKFFHSTGCPKCLNKGITGRFGIHEVLPVTHQIEAAVFTNPTDDQITALAQKRGMKTLREVALEKARKGLITIEEVLRLTE